MSYDSEENLQKRFENGLRSGNLSFEKEEEEYKSVNDFYDEWKDKNYHKSENDYDWGDGEPPKESGEDYIRDSYDRKYEEDGLED